MATDYYGILGINKGANEADIKSAYRRLAKQYHPDLYSNAPEQEKKKAEAKFKEINQAYSVLSDPSKKSNYDRFGSEDGPGMSGFGGGSGMNGGNGAVAGANITVTFETPIPTTYFGINLYNNSYSSGVSCTVYIEDEFVRSFSRNVLRNQNRLTRDFTWFVYADADVYNV